jgi:hypothetical protein
MKKFILIILLIGMSGCVSLTKPGAPFYGMGQKSKLDKATMLQNQGKTADAVTLLTEITEDPGVSGVTDEALFRLGILRLSSGFEANNLEQGKKDLGRLAKDYPASSWNLLALPLTEFLALSDKALRQGKKLTQQNLSLTKENKELKENNLSMARELKNVKESNVSLSKENAELRQRVEKLKSLDLDMEKGNKHSHRPRVR